MSTAVDTWAQALEIHDVSPERIAALAIRTDSRNIDAPPWAWPNLAADEAADLDNALDAFVHTYNRIHVSVLDEVIPQCWRLHPALAQEMPVQFWAWWCAYIDIKAALAAALEYYNKNLPQFQTRLATGLLGKSAANCRKGQHTIMMDPAVIQAISFDPAGPLDKTGRGKDTRRALHHIDFGTGKGQTS